LHRPSASQIAGTVEKPPPPGDTPVVQEFCDRIKGQAQAVWHLGEMDYGQREFRLRDPDGYTLAFAEELSR
jgi:hypothetical protein